MLVPNSILVCFGLAGSVIIKKQNEESSPFKVPLKAVPVHDKIRHDDHGENSFLQIDANQGPDYVLVGDVEVGTPGQRFRVIFDSGSGNLILPAQTCGSAACKMHNRFQPRLSLTSNQHINLEEDTSQQNNLVQLPFSSEHVEGINWQDRFCLGPKNGYCLNSTNFILAQEMPMQPFGALPADGIFGLALPSASVDPSFNLLYSMVQAGVVPRGMFAIWFPDKRTEKKHDGEITIGGFDDSKFVGELYWSQVKESGGTGRYELDLKGIHVSNDTGIAHDLSENIAIFQKQATVRTVIDTGTTILGGSQEIIDDLLDILDLTQTGRVECGTVSQRKRLGLHLGEKIFFLKPWDYIKRVGPKCYHLFSTMQLTKFDEPILLLGYPFLKRYYTVFDQDVQSVGMGLAKHETNGRDPPQEEELPRLIQQGPFAVIEDDETEIE